MCLCANSLRANIFGTFSRHNSSNCEGTEFEPSVWGSTRSVVSDHQSKKTHAPKFATLHPFRCILHTTKDKFIHCLCVIFLHTSHSSNSIRYQTATTHAINCTMNITLLSMHNHLKLWKIHKMRQHLRELLLRSSIFPEFFWWRLCVTMMRAQ